MFIVENVGQTEAFLKKRTLHTHWDKFCKKISRKITHVGEAVEKLEPLEAIMEGFYKIKN